MQEPVTPKAPENVGDRLWLKLENSIVGMVRGCEQKADARVAIMNAKRTCAGIGNAVGGAFGGVQRGFNSALDAIKGQGGTPATAGRR